MHVTHLSLKYLLPPNRTRTIANQVKNIINGNRIIITLIARVVTLIEPPVVIQLREAVTEDEVIALMFDLICLCPPFHQEIVAFEEWISPTPAEKEVRIFTIEAIVKALKVIYPRATVSAFGSTETGLYLPSGDIDLVLDLTFMPADSDFKLCLRQLAQNLEDLGLAAPGSIEVIERAQVPIVKFKSVYGLSNGIAGASFFRQFLFDGPNDQLRLMTDEGTLAFRSLVLILKILLESRGLEQVFSGGLSSYSVMCLVLSHLQLNPLARQGRHSSKTFLAALLSELLDLYGTRLDFNRVSVSVEDGGRLQDQKLRSRGQLMDASIVVEDPVNHVNNIARGCFQLEHVKALFNETYATLESALHLKGSILDSRREGTSFMLREEYDPEDLSILSHGLRLPQSVGTPAPKSSSRRAPETSRSAQITEEGIEDPGYWLEFLGNFFNLAFVY
ncbi:hypothetical protein GG344DRAFT_69556 [Lentinula edodes]|nr:hypothetical protein GG344DRAFT_69556 [Lentinula edodes]